MRKFLQPLAALALIAAPASAALAQAAPAARAASAQDAKAAGAFIDNLADQAFAILRDKSVTKPQARAKFRTMLRENFAVNEIGAYLLGRHANTITPAQRQAYMAAFPDWVVGTYADRLYDYASSDLRVVRTLPRGPRGDIEVFSRIDLPNGGQPINAVWTVRKAPNGKFQVQNLTVAGVNLKQTQRADFASYIERNGFDALVKFMRDAAQG
jgi:phospholipid transport system substrate-binding protein